MLVLAGSALSAQPEWNGLLWKISGKGLDSASFLYGTFHLLCPEDLDFSEETLDALGRTRLLALELDFDDPGLMAALQQHLFLEDGQSARDYLTEEEYELVSGFFDSELGMPFAQMDRIKPFFLSSMILLRTLDCEPASPEQQLAGLAGEQGMEVVGLETVEEQIGFVDNIPLEDAAKILVSDIREAASEEDMAAEIVEIYLSGDLAGIQEIIDEYMGQEYAGIQKGLITDRNRDWIPKIGQMITSQPTFIAVGAGHLPGKKGLIRLLQKKGYTVEPVRSAIH